MTPEEGSNQPPLCAYNLIFNLCDAFELIRTVAYKSALLIFGYYIINQLMR
jgi:hypothetical protein